VQSTKHSVARILFLKLFYCWTIYIASLCSCHTRTTYVYLNKRNLVSCLFISNLHLVKVCLGLQTNADAIFQNSLPITPYKTRRWHVTISCQPDGRPPQPVRPWKSGRVHLAECSKVVVLELPYSTEFGWESRKFASGVRKYGKFDDGR